MQLQCHCHCRCCFCITALDSILQYFQMPGGSKGISRNNFWPSGILKFNATIQGSLGLLKGCLGFFRTSQGFLGFLGFLGFSLDSFAFFRVPESFLGFLRILRVPWGSVGFFVFLGVLQCSTGFLWDILLTVKFWASLIYFASVSV